jgi:phenylalanyl-tRNA synthetase beta chain
MKISYNWLKSYVAYDGSVEAMSELLTSLGLEVEGIERFESIKGGLQGIITGHVVACEKHPNADKLSVTKVDVGQEALLDIVCGAPNVSTGQKVLVATVGTMLYDATGKPWKINKAKIRGCRSEGMICAEDELGLGKSHDGIVVLDSDTKIGVPASELYPVENDTVFEIGLTPNRSDATAHLGAAKDVLAALRIRFNQELNLQPPILSKVNIASSHAEINVEIARPDLCPRFSMLLLRNVRIGPSPEWMIHRLEAIGVRSISNVVDITNFVLHEYGQPMHAYDYAKIPDQTIVVDTLADGTPFTALDEVERKMGGDDLMICDKDRNPIGIAGVFGGQSTGVSDNTTEVLLEAAHFNAISTRKTSTKHNLRTEAAKCFEKGSDPIKTTEALQRAAFLLQEYAGATVEGPILDVYPQIIEPVMVKVSFEYIERVTGNHLPPSEIVRIIEAMEMPVRHLGDEYVEVEVPSDKADVTRPADILEEILRIYGYDNVKPDNKLHTTLVPTTGLEMYEFKEILADYMSDNGFDQMMNLSLSQSRYYPELADKLVPVLNTSNVHLDIMRPEMIISGLEAISFNINRRQTDLRLYEFGKSYQKGATEFVESDRLVIYSVGNWRSESWASDDSAVNYYDLKGLFDAILDRLGIKNFSVELSGDDRFAYGLDVVSNNAHLATIGSVAEKLKKLTDVKGDVFAIDISMKELYKLFTRNDVTFVDISKYPSTRRDIALVVKKSVQYADLEASIKLRGKKLVNNVNLFDVYENDDQLGADKRSYAISIIFEHADRTLTDKEVDKTMQKILGDLTQSYGVVQR